MVQYLFTSDFTGWLHQVMLFKAHCVLYSKCQDAVSSTVHATTVHARTPASEFTFSAVFSFSIDFRILLIFYAKVCCCRASAQHDSLWQGICTAPLAMTLQTGD